MKLFDLAAQTGAECALSDGDIEISGAAGLDQAQAGEVTFLSDPNLDAIKRYDLVHKGQGENGRDIARPAEFLIDSSDIVRWRMLTENYWVRARPEQVLEAAKALQ